MTKATSEQKIDTTLEREWGRFRRSTIIGLVRAVEAGEIRASDLASALFVTKTSISRYVNEMLDEGLLSQRRDPSDGRATLLSVSPAGRRELEERESRRSAVLRDLCRGWPKEDVTTLTTLLQRLNDGVHRRLNESAPR
jgi:DNA-binding MarR family transcriptional regulator